eukprot:366539-Chlamydomonas_euryale.AAC.17
MVVLDSKRRSRSLLCRNCGRDRPILSTAVEGSHSSDKCLRRCMTGKETAVHNDLPERYIHGSSRVYAAALVR